MRVRSCAFLSMGALLLLTACCAKLTPEERERTVPNNEHDSADSQAVDDAVAEIGAAFSQRDYPTALEKAKIALQLARADASCAQLVTCLGLAARMYSVNGDWETGRSLVKEAGEKTSIELGRPHLRYLWTLGRYAWHDEKIDKARNTYKEMLELANQQQRYRDAVDATHMLALIEPEKSDQVKWALEGIKAAEASGEEGWLGPLWNNLGWTYDEMGEHEKALEALLKARKYHQSSPAIPRAVAENSVGYAYFKVGKLDEAEMALSACLAIVGPMHAEDPSASEPIAWIGRSQHWQAEIALTRGNKIDAERLFALAAESLGKANPDHYNEWKEESLQRLAAISSD